MRKQPKKLKGAIPFQLNLQELRRELRKADQIIGNAEMLLTEQQEQQLYQMNINDKVATTADPLSDKSRYRAMHRIVQRHDNTKTLLILTIILLTITNIASCTDNDLLRAELEQIKYQQNNQTRS